MENTYVYLKSVFQNLKEENSQYPHLFSIVLMLWCIPLSYSLNSIALSLFVANVLWRKKKEIIVNFYLTFPIMLFMLMALSLFWTHEINSSVRALSKGLPFLLIPISFLLIPNLNNKFKQKTLHYFSIGIVLFTLFCLTKALIRYAISKNSNVFFYHELVTEDVNAIHVSVYVALAIICFLTKPRKSNYDKLFLILLITFLILLSSKNVIIIFTVLTVFYFFKNFRNDFRRMFIAFGVFFIILITLAFNGKIRDRFLIEFKSNIEKNSVNYEIGSPTEKVYNVSIIKAWEQDYFQPNDFFPGTAFRVYQIRIFTEMLQEDPIFFTGYGLNATDFKIAEKRIQHNLFPGYEKKNFHNEYIQIFAELGIFGLILLLIMVIANLINGIKNKDFIHISFAILMLSLFLTESFLSRQRGIVFFIILYCLFNNHNHSQNQIFKTFLVFKKKLKLT